jgi:hypothetical protein
VTRPITGVADLQGDGVTSDMHDPATPSARRERDPADDAVRSEVDDTSAGDDTPTTASGWQWQPVDLLVATVFLAFGYYIMSRLWHSPTSLAPNSNPNDPTFFEWMLVHAVRIFTHGDNPFFTSQLNAPSGVNLMSNTNMLGLTIPFAPLTAWLGPSPVVVLIAMLGLSGTAFAWYYVFARHFIGHRLGAFVGGAFCGFGPGIMTHANGHPNITAQFVIPFIVLRALALRNSTRPLRDGVIVGLLVTYQTFINEEVLFLTALAGAIFAITYVAFRPSMIKLARPMLTGLFFAAATAGALLAYPLWFQFRGPQHFSGLPSMLNAYPYWLPLNSFVKLPSLSHWGIPYMQPHSFPTGTEQNSFLGWAVLVVTVAIIAVLWLRRPAVRALAIVGVLFAWASMGGGRISLNGQPNSTTYPISLWKHLSKVPLIDSVLPSRLALVLVPVIGALLAFAVADAYTALGRAFEERRALSGALLPSIALAAIVAALITVVPTPVPVSGRSVVPMFFTSGDWRQYVPAGDSVLSATPYSEQDYMRWAVAENLDFKVAGGYFLGPAPLTAGQKTPTGQYGPQWRQTMVVLGAIGIGEWSLPTDDSEYQSDVVPDLTYWHTSIIVLTEDQPQYAASKNAVTRLTGLTGSQVDDVWVWDVRSLIGQ